MDEEQKRLAEELLFADKKPPSLAKKLFFGVLDPQHIFPYPQPKPEELAQITPYLEQIKKFAEQSIDPDWIDRNASIPPEVLKGLADMGVFGMSMPREFGGLGMSQHAYCRASEILAARCGSTALFVNVHQSIGIRALLLFGSKEQQARWLLPLAKGEKFAAFSLTEPNAGSDANGIETRAVYDPERKVYRITGKKQWTTNGSVAHVLTVMARTEIDTPKGKRDKITAFLVTPDMPGFKVTAESLEKVGMRGTKTANLAFDNMEVPEANILGPLGGGLKVCLTVLDFGRTTFGATCTGTAKMLLERSIAHARNRHQFGRPLASFALVKKKLASMAALTYAMDATTYLTAGLLDSGVEDFMLETAMLKVFTSDSLWKIIYDTMQIFGGRSFFKTEPFERNMRDARLNMIGEGSNEVLRAFIGAVGMRDVGMELKDVLDGLKQPWNNYDMLWKFSQKAFRRWSAGYVPVKSGLLKKEAKELEYAIRQFGISIVRVLARYKEEVVEKQLDLDRIATAAMAIYTTIAVLSKLDTDLANHQNKDNDVAVVKLYCQLAMATVKRSLGTLFNPLDTQIEAVSDML